MGPTEIRITLTAINQAEAALKAAQAGLQQVAAAGNAAGAALQQSASVGSSALGQLQASAQKVGGAFASMGEQVKQGIALGFGINLATTIAGGIQAGLSAAGEAVIGFNAKLQSAQAAFTGLLGSSQAAASFLKDLQQFAATSPFEFKDVLVGAQRFVGMGMSAQSVIPLLKDIGTIVSAMGGGSQQINEVTLAIAQMSARGKVSAQEMNQLANAGVQGWKILADAMNLPIGQVMKLAEQGEISADVFIAAMQKAANTPEMKAVADNMGRSWNTAISNLADGATRFISTAGKPLFDALSNAVLALGNWLTTSKEAEVLAANLATIVSGLVTGFGQLFGAIGQVVGVLERFGGTLPGIQALGAAMFSVNQAAADPKPAQEQAKQSAEIARQTALAGEYKQAAAEIASKITEQKTAQEANTEAIKRNAVEQRNVETAIRDVKAQADGIKQTYEDQISVLQREAKAWDESARANQAQIAAVKQGYADLEAPIKAAQQATGQLISDTKTQIDDIKSAYADLKAPIEDALKGVESQLRANSVAAKETKDAYESAIDPLQKQVDALLKAGDAEKRLQDLQDRAKSDALKLAMINAEGDPAKRAALALKLEENGLAEKELELRKTLQDTDRQIKDLQDEHNKKKSDGKKLSDDEYNVQVQLLQKKKEDARAQLDLLDMTDKEGLARAKVALATLDQQTTVRQLGEDQKNVAAQIEAIPIQEKIAALKKDEAERLAILATETLELEQQKDNYQRMLEGMQASEEAALKPFEAKLKALEQQQTALAGLMEALKAQEDAALAPLEARAAAIKAAQDDIKTKIDAAKDAESAALKPIQDNIDALEGKRAKIQEIGSQLANEKAQIEINLEAFKKEEEQLNTNATAAQKVADTLAKAPKSEGLAANAETIKAMNENLPLTVDQTAKLTENIKAQGAGALEAVTPLGRLSETLDKAGGFWKILNEQLKETGAYDAIKEAWGTISEIGGTLAKMLKDDLNPQYASSELAAGTEKAGAAGAAYILANAIKSIAENINSAATDFKNFLTWLDNTRRTLDLIKDILLISQDPLKALLAVGKLLGIGGGGIPGVQQTGLRSGVPDRGAAVGDLLSSGVPVGGDEEQRLAAIYQQVASQAGEEMARVFVAVAKTEGGLFGAVGDSGNAFGPFQFNTGGQLPNFARYLGTDVASAAEIARTNIPVATQFALETYLGSAVRQGQAQGLSGSALATYAQRYGQVSINPEKAGQNYAQMFGTAGVDNQTRYDLITAAPPPGVTVPTAPGVLTPEQLQRLKDVLGENNPAILAYEAAVRRLAGAQQAAGAATSAATATVESQGTAFTGTTQVVDAAGKTISVTYPDLMRLTRERAQQQFDALKTGLTGAAQAMNDKILTGQLNLSRDYPDLMRLTKERNLAEIAQMAADATSKVTVLHDNVIQITDSMGKTSVVNITGMHDGVIDGINSMGQTVEVRIEALKNSVVNNGQALADGFAAAIGAGGKAAEGNARTMAEQLDKIWLSTEKDAINRANNIAAALAAAQKGKTTKIKAGDFNLPGELGNYSFGAGGFPVSSPLDNPQDIGVTLPTEARASGGPIMAGRPYWVGESGPELVVPRFSGTVLSANASRRMDSDGGTTIVQHHHFSPTIHVAGHVLTEQDLIDVVKRGFNTMASRNLTAGLR